MAEGLTDDVLDQALAACAAEPVHIPGTVQPFACLLAIDPTTERIIYVSENTETFVGANADHLLGRDLREALGSEIVHGLRNAAANSDFGHALVSVGTLDVGGVVVAISVFKSENYYVLEIEPAIDPGFGGEDALNTLSFLMKQIQACPNRDALFDLTVRLLRHLTGYERVMVYKFDQDYNGEVLAEICPRTMEPYRGLRFPHWDIPAQARALMAKLPLRFIQDVRQTPVRLRSAEATLPPLDITFATCRGVSVVHMQYLQNMGIKATMTLSIMVDGALWGMISFHHRQPRVPAPPLREVLTNFVSVFAVKLQALEQQERLMLISKVDQIRDQLLNQIDDDESVEGALPRVGPVVEEIMGAAGVAVLIGSQTQSSGRVPQQAVLTRLLEAAQARVGEIITIENLGAHFPELSDGLNGCAGVLAAAINPNRALCIFRTETIQAISWAGNPEKTVETVSGQTRLAPRGSFSTYLQERQGCCQAWSEQDTYFARRIWALVNSAERRALLNTLNRHQNLMINELNHRVRNILALVRSVSRQARRRYGSLNSYAGSLESRIQALAAAHDIASGSGVSAVGVKNLIEAELEPYKKQVQIDAAGSECYLRADIAPIFSLVIHELATNAAKYGATSVEEGRVIVNVSSAAHGVSVSWRESGGPAVTPPPERGFGSTLIEHAVPHEMGGRAKLNFASSGVEAEFFLPDEVFDVPPRSANLSHEPIRPIVETDVPPFSAQDKDGIVLILEDNFVLAKEMSDQITDFGFSDVEIVSCIEDANDFLDIEKPVLVVLDVNLGSGKRSVPVAQRLIELQTPFVFVTGYGDKVELPTGLQHVPVLTKPVSTSELRMALQRLLAASA